MDAMKPAPKLPVRGSGSGGLLEAGMWIVSVAAMYASVIIFSLMERPCSSGEDVSSCPLAPFSRQHLFEMLIAWGFEIIGVATIELFAQCCCYFERAPSVMEFIRAGFHLLMTVIGMCLWGSSASSAGAIGANMVAAASSGLIYFLLEVVYRQPGKMEWCSSSCSWAFFKCLYFLPLVAMTGVTVKAGWEENHILSTVLSISGAVGFAFTSTVLVRNGNALEEDVNHSCVLSEALMEKDNTAESTHHTVEVGGYSA